MLSRIDSILISIVLLLGVAHTAFTPVFYKSFSLDAIWFAGTGLAFVFLGLLHISRRTSTSSLAVVVSCFASVVATIFSILIVLKMTAPQAYISVVVNALLAVTSGMTYRLTSRGSL